MNSFLISAMNFMQNSFGKKEKTKKELSKEEKKEVEKLNSSEMGIYSAFKYLSKKYKTK